MQSKQNQAFVLNRFFTCLTDPCSMMKCQHKAACKVTINDTVSCSCPSVYDCSLADKALCGSDGKSYLNECHLNAEICQNQRDIKINHMGRCGNYI